jgi:hypothetical protein
MVKMGKGYLKIKSGDSNLVMEKVICSFQALPCCPL